MKLSEMIDVTQLISFAIKTWKQSVNMSFLGELVFFHHIKVYLMFSILSVYRSLNRSTLIVMCYICNQTDCYDSYIALIH